VQRAPAIGHAMTPPPFPSPPDKVTGPFLVRLRQLFDRMDRAYDRAASAYGFVCRGCEDNCCHTRFSHHTLLEFLTLKRGWGRLPGSQRTLAAARSRSVLEQYRQADGSGTAARVLCPLNRDGDCTLYRHRPMICRLHGIPHELRQPGGKVAGPGCADFDRQACGRPYVVFDRTPLYRDLALLERELRVALGLDPRQRFKYTVADVIVGLATDGESGGGGGGRLQEKGN
jgi:Fe-S-cluster containining protein